MAYVRGFSTQGRRSDFGLLTISQRDCIGILILLHNATAVQEVFK
jgi:hypothetical protein